LDHRPWRWPRSPSSLLCRRLICTYCRTLRHRPPSVWVIRCMREAVLVFSTTPACSARKVSSCVTRARVADG
jgi:hypothetical protein